MWEITIFVRVNIIPDSGVMTDSVVVWGHN